MQLITMSQYIVHNNAFFYKIEACILFCFCSPSEAIHVKQAARAIDERRFLLGNCDDGDGDIVV